MTAYTVTTPKLSVDCVVVTPERRVLLIRRRWPPAKGALALPGGFVEVGETVERACVRELAEETGVALPESALRLIGVYSDPARDSRWHTVTVAFLAQAEVGSLRAGDDAADAVLLHDWRHAEIAFDHKDILRAAFAMLA
jgi:8-oxo-dGTP diphosphatase|tara:strand:+ start:1598 stop:2017 length:420 start_codon:yes stop_codon:yes gene_type:complete